jgi:hypothetical protein
MAGLPSGAPSPTFHHVPVITRTRREFGAAQLEGGEVVTVQASRRVRECIGVNLQVADQAGGDMLRGLLQPAQARMLARALIEAAAAVDQAQRQPQFTRGEVRHG